MSKRNTGLGTNAFFQTLESTKEESDQTERPGTAEIENTKPEEEQKTQVPKHIRTTVRLYAETFAALEMIKVMARKEGNKITYGDILDEAIQEIIKKKGIEF